MQIRGYPVRFDIDVLILFSANPATYNRSGKVIPQLKDRIGTVIHTHYPRERSLGIEIMEQEAGIELDGEFPVAVPYFMREIIEQMSIAARRSKYIDQQSGVSARFSIANYRTMVASARQRGAVLGERPAVPRISDLGHLYSSSLGKLELDMMSSHQMSERQVLDAILAEAIRDVFEEYVDRHGLDEIAEIFGRGVKIEVGDLLPSEPYAERLERVPPAWEKAFEVNASSDPAVRASCVEFVLAGLYATDRISRAAATRADRVRNHLMEAVRGSAATQVAIQPCPATDRRHHPHVPEVRSAGRCPARRSRRRTWSPARWSTCWPTASMRELTEEELARAVQLDPSQIAGLGPSLEALMEMLAAAEAEDPGDLRDRPGAGRGRPPLPRAGPGE